VYTAEGKYVEVKIPLSIYGARGKTTLVGVGLMIKGKKSDGIVEIEDLTIKGGEGAGLIASRGMNVIMRGCSVVDSTESGVFATGADISCDNLQVVGCGRNGVIAFNKATIMLSGQGTSIQRNKFYGLNALNASSIIHLIRPLTKEQISTNNGGGGNWGGNWGGDGTIEQVSK